MGCSHAIAWHAQTSLIFKVWPFILLLKCQLLEKPLHSFNVSHLKYSSSRSKWTFVIAILRKHGKFSFAICVKFSSLPSHLRITFASFASLWSVQKTCVSMVQIVRFDGSKCLTLFVLIVRSVWHSIVSEC